MLRHHRNRMCAGGGGPLTVIPATFDNTRDSVDMTITDGNRTAWNHQQTHTAILTDVKEPDGNIWVVEITCLDNMNFNWNETPHIGVGGAATDFSIFDSVRLGWDGDKGAAAHYVNNTTYTEQSTVGGAKEGILPPQTGWKANPVFTIIVNFALDEIRLGVNGVLAVNPLTKKPSQIAAEDALGKMSPGFDAYTRSGIHYWMNAGQDPWAYPNIIPEGAYGWGAVV